MRKEASSLAVTLNEFQVTQSTPLTLYRIGVYQYRELAQPRGDKQGELCQAFYFYPRKDDVNLNVRSGVLRW